MISIFALMKQNLCQEAGGRGDELLLLLLPRKIKYELHQSLRMVLKL